MIAWNYQPLRRSVSQRGFEESILLEIRWMGDNCMMHVVLFWFTW